MAARRGGWRDQAQVLAGLFALSTAGITLYFVFNSALSLGESLATGAAVAGVGAAVILALRLLFLPVQFFRHRAAVRAFLNRRRMLATDGDRMEILQHDRLVRATREDPRATPWWDWEK